MKTTLLPFDRSQQRSRQMTRFDVKQDTHNQTIICLKGRDYDVDAVQQIAQKGHGPYPNDVAGANVIAYARITIQRLSKVGFAAAT